jgi:putative cell wall-binding protein
MVNKVAQRAIAAGLAGMMSFGAVAPAAMALDNWTGAWWNVTDLSSDEGLDYFKRIAGTDRYGTMKKIVEKSYNVTGDKWWNAPVAVIASGENFPDALAANGLAGALNNGEGAPVILTKKGSLSSEAKTLLKNLQVQTVYIMGGTAAVSEATENAIRDMHIATIRVAGADRQATSVQAFNLIDGNWYKQHGTHSVIIATGANYADALSIAPFAYATGTPIILTKADGTLTDEAVKAIKANDEIYQIIVVGGTAAVSDSVFSALGTYTGSYKDYYDKVYIPVRIAGADRYATSANIADWEVNYALETLPYTKDFVWADFSYAWTFVATGENFPDALAGGQLAGGKWYVKDAYTNTDKTHLAHSPILLTKDGNNTADMVIAKNLNSWNGAYTAYEVDAYNLTSGTFKQYLQNMAEKYVGNTAKDYYKASKKDYRLALNYDVEDGFYSVSTTDPYDFFKSDQILYVSYDHAARTKDNTFHGIIFGGQAAVSKAKAKELDQTVKDNIYKYTDRYAIDSDYVKTIGNTKYYTLGYYLRQFRDYGTTVQGVGDLSGTFKDITALFPIYTGDSKYFNSAYDMTLLSMSADYDGFTETVTAKYRINFALYEYVGVNDPGYVALDGYYGYRYVGDYAYTFDYNHTTGTVSNIQYVL